MAEDDCLFELISRSQSRRIDDQRCSARHLTPRSGTLSHFPPFAPFFAKFLTALLNDAY